MKTFLVTLFVGISAFAGNQKLTLSGSSTVAPLALELSKIYEKKQSSLRIDVQSGGSSKGVADSRSGLVDIGMVSRALKAEESDLVASTIARDGVALIVHSSNPVRELSDKQIKGIYTGVVKNWKEVGGKDAPITVVSKAEGRSTLELFLEYFKLKNSEVKAAVIVGENEQDIKVVSGNPNAIGYVSVGAAEVAEKSKIPLKLLPLNGIPASSETVRNGKFPLARPLNLVTKGAPGPLAKSFIEFCQSKDADPVIKDLFFVPLNH